VTSQNPQQLLAGITGRAGDRDPGGVRAVALRPRGVCSSLENCMHQKEYLYTHVLEEAIEIDV